MKKSTQKGQLLLELLLAIAVLAAVGLTFATMLDNSLSYGRYFKNYSTANGLLTELQERAKALADYNWNAIYNITKGPCSDETCHYTIVKNGSQWQIQQGEETISLNDVDYKRYLIVYNVKRDSSTENIVGTGGINDPLTQKIVIYINWENKTKSISSYITRAYEETTDQTDWSDGPVGEEVSNQATTTFSTSTLVDYYTTSGQIQLEPLP